MKKLLWNKAQITSNWNIKGNVKNICVLLCFLLICYGSVKSQSRQDLEQRRTQTMNEIRYTNRLISETKESQRESYNHLLLINNKINSRRELINHINNEVRMVEDRIVETEGIIKSLEDDLEKLKEEYANMIRIAWKNKNNINEIMFLFSAETFNQSFLRLKHMQQFADYRKRQFSAINYLKDILSINVEKLQEDKNIKEQLLAEERAEAQQLNRERRTQQSTIQSLKAQETELRKKLEEQQRQAQRLQAEIERLIAEEAKRTSGHADVYKLTPAEQIISTNFGNNRGKLPWPVERGVVVSSYGKQRHPVLANIEIDNRGVDIATTKGAMARAIFDGEVRRIVDLPGAHTAVIIRHGEYLSVYTNLKDVLVEVGENVATNQYIGTIYTDESENKTIIHLEIWQGNTTLNPALWLSR